MTVQQFDKSDNGASRASDPSAAFSLGKSSFSRASRAIAVGIATAKAALSLGGAAPAFPGAVSQLDQIGQPTNSIQTLGVLCAIGQGTNRQNSMVAQEFTAGTTGALRIRALGRGSLQPGTGVTALTNNGAGLTVTFHFWESTNAFRANPFAGQKTNDVVISTNNSALNWSYVNVPNGTGTNTTLVPNLLTTNLFSNFVVRARSEPFVVGYSIKEPNTTVDTSGNSNWIFRAVETTIPRQAPGWSAVATATAPTPVFTSISNAIGFGIDVIPLQLVAEYIRPSNSVSFFAPSNIAHQGFQTNSFPSGNWGDVPGSSNQTQITLPAGSVNLNARVKVPGY